MWKARLVAMQRAKRKSSKRSLLLTEKCATVPFHIGSKTIWCRTHERYVRKCDACAARYHAKYRLLRGFCSRSCRNRDHRKRKANP